MDDQSFTSTSKYYPLSHYTLERVVSEQYSEYSEHRKRIGFESEMTLDLVDLLMPSLRCHCQTGQRPAQYHIN